MSQQVTLYSTDWCGYCRRLKRQLDERGVAYREIDIDLAQHAVHGDRIVARTGGFRTVPTVEVGDAMLVNPSLPQVLEALAGSPAGSGRV